MGCNKGKPGPIPPWPMFLMGSPPVVPALYWDAVSDEQRIHDICCELHRLIEYANSIGMQVNLNAEDIERLEAELEDFRTSGFDQYYQEQFLAWLEEHLQLIWERLGKMVWFGLTSDGYFCAYVPESWSDITFDTGAVYGTAEYGRLILRYYVDGQGVIDNTGTGYDLGGLLADLEELRKRVDRNDGTLYTALQRMEEAVR